MRAHFANDSFNESQTLEERIVKFKECKEDMQVLVDFVNNILLLAQKEAENKLKLQQNCSKPGRETSVFSNLKNGKIINRARGVVTRIFDVLCNRASLTSSNQNVYGNKGKD